MFGKGVPNQKYDMPSGWACDPYKTMFHEGIHVHQTSTRPQQHENHLNHLP